MSRNNETTWLQLLFWYSFFMAFPYILLFGYNISVFIFAVMFLFLLLKGKKRVITVAKGLQWVAVFFGIGAIISTMLIPAEAPRGSFERALTVLPNYLYWSLLVIFLISNRSILNIKTVYKGIFGGVLATLLYYIAPHNSLKSLSFFGRMTPNGFAFLLVCYSPMATYYVLHKYGKFWASLFLLILVYTLFHDGRRAGTVLVFLGGMAVLYASQINWKNIFAFALVVMGMIFLLRTSLVERAILRVNERIYYLVYEPGNITLQDRSYLTRVAMVKKGLAIYNKHPFTGIGLNNFTNYSIPFEKKFEGAEFVVNKHGIQETSSHNSYISILSEGGLFLFIPFLLLIGACLYTSFFYYFTMKPDIRPIYIGCTAMAIHFYFISAVVNVFAWFLIGLACVFIHKR